MSRNRLRSVADGDADLCSCDHFRIDHGKYSTACLRDVLVEGELTVCPCMRFEKA